MMMGRFLSMILVPNREAIEAAKRKAAQEEATRQAERSGSESEVGETDA
jgi:hypothetical protein